MADKKRFWTVKEAASELTLSERKIYDLVAAKEIPHVRLTGGAIRFDPVAISEWIASKTHDPATDSGAIQENGAQAEQQIEKTEKTA